jgi:hypothetical protein
MKNFKRLLASLVMFMTLLGISPITAHAEWKQGNNGWWYSQGGSSYATGWTQLNGQWYYFDSNGYMKTGWLYDSGNWFYLYGDGTMAHDTTIEGNYLNSYGAWSTNVPTYTTGNTGGTTASATINNQSQTAYLSATGSKYHSIPNCGNMNPNRATKTTVAEAEAEGYGRCSKCW